MQTQSVGRVATAPSTRMVGRVDELHLLEQAVLGSAGGAPCAVFVRGEAGVGKTRLVDEVCRNAERRGSAVLWGRCVRFGGAAAPLVPITAALRGWLMTAGSVSREAAFPGLDGLAELFPSLGMPRTSEGSGRLIPLIDAAISRICAHQPVVLVVDDVQWADITSLDLLASLVTGFHTQRLAVLVTCRDEDVGEGHPLHGWRADLRRLPSVREVSLDRLGYDETQEQIESITRRVPPRRLVEQVYERSRGNAYLTELLVKKLRPGATELPPGLPAALSEALTAKWHGLSPVSREVVRLLAVGGRPFGIDPLVQVAHAMGTTGSGRNGVQPALGEAVDHGVVETDRSGRYWFRHPLLAEVLYETLLPAQTVVMHEAFAAVLESTPSGPGDDRRRLGDLALHQERSGRPDRAFDYLLGAAEKAGDVHAYPEQAKYLRRAVDLWEDGPGARAHAGGQIELLERAGASAMRALDVEGNAEMMRRALRLTDREARPLEAARVICKLSDAQCNPPDSEQRLIRAREAIALSEPYPDSPEYATALTVEADVLAWRGDVRARPLAEKAVTVGRRSRSAEAQIYALATRSFAYLPGVRALEDARECFGLAEQSGQPHLIDVATVALVNYLEEVGRMREAADVDLASMEAVRRVGTIPAFPASLAGHHLLWLGDLAGCREVLREALAARMGAHGGAPARLVAVRLACRLGSTRHEATQHLVRAREMVPDLESFIGMFAPLAIAEYQLWLGDAEEALHVLERNLPAHVTDARVADQMLTWAARAAADLAEQARDRGDDGSAANAVQRLESLVSRREELAGADFHPVGEEDLAGAANRALFLAESARCRGDHAAERSWRQAAEACATAGCRWDEALSLWRWAQTLSSGGAGRIQIAVPLRAAHAITREIGAVPLREQVEALARLARVSLEEPVIPVQADGGARLALLTRREREILAHIVAGRTYAEIADALFISVKTVSVHVSNLLRKTGAANRAEVAAMGLRLGAGGAPETPQRPGDLPPGRW